MTRRQLIATAAAVVLVAANGAVWYAGRQPERTPPNTRQVLRARLVESWENLPATPIADTTEALRQAITTSGSLEAGGNSSSGGRSVAHAPLSSRSKADLLEAITGAVAVIGAADSDKLAAYMKGRGLKTPHRIQQATGNIAAHAVGVVPDATEVYIWKPRSLLEVSMVQLGRNESWVWGNEKIYLPSFTGSPVFEQVSRSDPALLADVRVLVDHDESLDSTRSPYFLRFWYAEEAKQWRPLALKVVWTGSQHAPALLF